MMQEINKGCFKRFFLTLFLFCGFLCSQAAIFIVDTNADTDNLAAYMAADGTNSLRKCIRLANSLVGTDNIQFNITGTGPFTITLTSALPDVTQPLIIDGLTQPGASAGTLMIEINGTGVTNCLHFDFGADASVVNGLVLNRANRGIYITRVANMTVTACYIGTNVSGTAALPCIWNGMELDDADNTIIGGTSGQLTRNIISGNNEVGVRMQNGSTGTTILGNYLGVTATGNAALGNGWYAVYALPGSNNTVIGSGTVGGGNILAACGRDGLAIEGATGCSIKGNSIGLGLDGVTLLPNAWAGISFNAGANNGIVGGATLNERNIISGNQQNGISFNNSTTGLVSGNFIGTDITGMLDKGNAQCGIIVNNLSSVPTILFNLISGNDQSGILLINSANGTIKGNVIGLAVDGTTVLPNGGRGISIENTSNNTIVGGTTLAERNLISANQQVGIAFNNSTGCSLLGSYIGTDVTGLLDRGNAQIGVFVDNLSANTTIGNGAAGGGNIISGNDQNGILIINSTDAIVKGNKIGVGADGTTSLPNAFNGVDNENNSHRLILGGTTVNERNIISSNGQSGVLINSSTDALIQGNYIGTDITGLVVKGNAQGGLRILPNSHNPIIGGNTTAAGNLISNNGWSGITVEGSTGAVIKANTVGLALNKTMPMGNNEQGIRLVATSPNAIIGGVLPAERNYISSNLQDGMYISQSNFATIVNNYVGVDGTGLLNRGNLGNGINITECTNMIIGGTTFSSRNILSGNGGNGLRIVTNSNNAVIKANFMGVGANGTAVIGNFDNGIYASDSSNQLIIGGSTLAERNVLSGNGLSGVGDGFRSESCARHIIKGNYCGVDSTGTIIMGNAWAGISLNESVNCTVGGTTSPEGNICSGNQNEGVYFRNAVNTKFIGNFVGTDKTGTLQLGNEDFAINIRAVSTNNTIGGSLAEANTIAYNKNIAGSGPGVFVEGASQYNTITYNKIYCNAGKGIELNGTANESIPKPVIMTSSTNLISGSGSVDGDIIHVYRNNTTGTGCDCEGEQFIGTTIVSGGTWTLTHNLGLTTAETGTLTATETTVLKSTSEFADCLVPLPVSLLYFTVTKQPNQSSLLQWKTGFEKNNDYFEIERSIDGIHFETIGTVKGAGNSATSLSYSFTDENPSPDINYYRLKQIDLDRRYEYSVIRTVNFGETQLAIVSEKGVYFILANFEKGVTLQYELYSAEGREVRKGNYTIESGKGKIELDLTGLANAIYYIKINVENSYLSDKLLVK
jgi:hypothetical protein